jgi:methionyl-tRNA formyltransferase
MMNTPLRIIFMGTPDFSVPSLRILVEARYDVVAVVTAPDRPAGRGLQVHMSPVKEYALSQNIPVLQPEKLKEPEFLGQLRSCNADLQVVVAFRMLPEVIWQMPRLGTFNLHTSLLPDYRGAAPINWAVINGEKETGVTTFFLKHEIDTGDIIFQEKIGIGPDENAGSVHDRLMVTGANLVLKTVNTIASGTIITIPQVIAGKPKAAPKIFKDDCRIKWKEMNLDHLHNIIRGLSPYPGAWTTLDHKILKIYASKKEPADILTDDYGKIDTDHKTFIKVSCNGGYLHMIEVQIEGKKKMSIEDFLRGYRIQDMESLD